MVKLFSDFMIKWVCGECPVNMVRCLVDGRS